MKKLISSPSISTTLQLLGVLINGMVGNTLELIAHMIDSIQDKSTTTLFIKKFIIIVLSQVAINHFLADHSMLVDMVLWVTEKNYKILWKGIEMWIAIGNTLNLLRVISISIEFSFLLFPSFPDKDSFETLVNNNHSLANCIHNCS